MKLIVTTIFAIAAAVSGVLAFYYYLTGNHFGKDIIKFYNTFARRVPAKRCLSGYFNTIKSPKIKYVVYQFGLRPYLPLIDVLYLEYLNNLINKNEIDNIIIFPSIDLSSSQQDDSAFSLFRLNILKIFKNHENNVIFFNPFDVNSIDNKDFTSPDFLETIKYIGSEKYFNYLQKEWKKKIRNINDFNIYHPVDAKLLVIFTHLIGAWQVIKLLKKNYLLQDSSSQNIEIGFLFWETEVDKLGVFKKFSEDNENVKLSILLGKTILDKNRRPMPVFVQNYSINLFQKINDSFVKINNCSKNMIIQYIRVLETILSNNYDYTENNEALIKDGKRIFEQEIISGRNSRIELMCPNQFYTLISLLNRLMIFYGNGCHN